MLRLRALRLGPHAQLRHLNLHEFRSAELFRQHGIAVPRGVPAFSGAEAAQAFAKLGEPRAVLKAQVLTGGRGKGVLDTGIHGVQVVGSAAEAEKVAGLMIHHKIVTKQTGPKGKIVSGVYLVAREQYTREAYLSVLYDRALQLPVIVASPRGGGDIEEVAKTDPDAIRTFPVSLDAGLTADAAREIARFMQFDGPALPLAAEAVQNLWRLFDERDCTLAEVNPLVESEAGTAVALDAKLNFDDNASFRQQEVFGWRDLSQEDPDEVAARSVGLNFIKLDGNIGCLVNGAGLAMATMDLVKLNNGSPANFLDCGGGATAESIEEAFHLILKGESIAAVFVNIFGGIVRCDDIAQGLIATAKSMDIKVPIVARLQGTNFDRAAQLIEDSKLKIFMFKDLDEAAKQVVQLGEIVRLGREANVTVSFDRA